MRHYIAISIISAILGISSLGCNLFPGVVSPEVSDDPGDQQFSEPVAMAQANPNPQIKGSMVNFTSTGSNDPDGGSLILFEWDWDNDGVYDANGPSTSRSWSNPGIYYVQLRITDDESTTDTLDTPLQVVIEGSKVPPVAAASASPNPQGTGMPVNFSDNGSYDPDGGSIVNFEWDWNNDGTFDSTGAAIDHTWASPGVYAVQFRVTDDESATDILDTPLQITISDQKVPPVAAASASPNPQVPGSPVHFSDNGSYDPDGGSIVSFEWDWNNDGTFDSTGAAIDHTWASPGVYAVQFRVTDDESATATLDTPLQITIGDQKVPPVAAVSANPNPQTAGSPVHFSDNGSYDPDGGAIAKFEWDWNNDGTFDNVGAAIDHTWASPGVYVVQFRVTDDESATDILDTPLQITISDQKVPPVAAASANPTPQTAGSPVHFSDNGSYDPDGGAIAKFEWDWNDDGTFDNVGASIDHTWASAGIYTVQFRVTDDENATDTLDTPFQITINAQNLPPVAVAGANPNPQNAGSSVHFSGAGSNDPDGGSIVSYEWDWNNDGIYESTGAEVDHTFATAGIYSVQLRVTDDEASTDTLNTPLQMTINPVQVQTTWDNTIGAMLHSGCSPCHITSSSAGKNYSTYANFVNSNVVDLGNPANSKVYKTIKNHSHYGDLTNTQLATLLEWITAGIPEN